MTRATSTATVTETAVRDLACAFGTPNDHGTAASQRDFKATEDGYRLTLCEVGIVFDLARVRREHGELWGELTVTCDLAGARVLDDDRTLTVADFNLSSLRARQDRARFLETRSQAPECDWQGLVEEFCVKALRADRAGQPAIHLPAVSPPDPAEDFDLDGLVLPKRHPVIVFGDGGSLKSYLGLWIAGQLSRRGVPVLYADWEFTAEDHRDRLERLFGPDMPDVLYARCERPLTAEADRLRRLVQTDAVEYLICDSVAFATDGPPESAECASDYFRALRSAKVGSLNIAHITKGENGDQKPFGSVFWHNGARATWYVERSRESPDARRVALALFNRKVNRGPLLPAVGFEFDFGDGSTTIRRVDAASVDDFAAKLPLWQRMRTALRHGPMTLVGLAGELDAKVETLEREVRRRDQLFTRVPGAEGVSRVALFERRAKE